MMRMTISVRSFTIAAVLGLAAMQPPPSIHADVVTLNAVADANLADLAGVGVFDSLNDLNASSYGLVAENFRGYSANLDFERRAVIEFNLAPLASAAVIQSISFTFETVSIANGPHAINVVGCLGGLRESFAAAGSRPRRWASGSLGLVYGGLFAAAAVAISVQWARLDLAPLASIVERSARTVVELREGQTLAIAGLLQITTDASTSRVPGLGDLPFLGPMFSFNTITTVETEMIILVTPELVAPLDRHEVTETPGARVNQPSDAEFYFLGRLEGKLGTEFRATKAEQDPLNLMKHFQSEREWVIGPHGYAD